MNTIQSFKKLLLTDNPPNLFFCIRRDKNGKIYEVYNVFNLKDHLKEKVYTLKETYEILKDYKNQ